MSRFTPLNNPQAAWGYERRSSRQRPPVSYHDGGSDNESEEDAQPDTGISQPETAQPVIAGPPESHAQSSQPEIAESVAAETSGEETENSDGGSASKDEAQVASSSPGGLADSQVSDDDQNTVENTKGTFVTRGTNPVWEQLRVTILETAAQILTQVPSTNDPVKAAASLAQYPHRYLRVSNGQYEVICFDTRNDSAPGLMKLQRDIADLRTENAALKETASGLVELQRRVAELGAENEKLNEDKREMDNNLTKVNEQVSNARRKAERLEVEIKKKKKKNSEMEGLKTELELRNQENARLAETIGQLETISSTLSKILEVSRASQMPPAQPAGHDAAKPAGEAEPAIKSQDPETESQALDEPDEMVDLIPLDQSAQARAHPAHQDAESSSATQGKRKAPHDDDDGAAAAPASKRAKTPAAAAAEAERAVGKLDFSRQGTSARIAQLGPLLGLTRAVVPEMTWALVREMDPMPLPFEYPAGSSQMWILRCPFHLDWRACGLSGGTGWFDVNPAGHVSCFGVNHVCADHGYPFFTTEELVEQHGTRVIANRAWSRMSPESFKEKVLEFARGKNEEARAHREERVREAMEKAREIKGLFE